MAAIDEVIRLLRPFVYSGGPGAEEEIDRAIRATVNAAQGGNDAGVGVGGATLTDGAAASPLATLSLVVPRACLIVAVGVVNCAPGGAGTAAVMNLGMTIDGSSSGTIVTLADFVKDGPRFTMTTIAALGVSAGTRTSVLLGSVSGGSTAETIVAFGGLVAVRLIPAP